MSSFWFILDLELVGTTCETGFSRIHLRVTFPSGVRVGEVGLTSFLFYSVIYVPVGLTSWSTEHPTSSSSNSVPKSEYHDGGLDGVSRPL